MKAAAKPDAAFVRDLLAQGANPLIKDSPWGDTALDKSVYEAIKFGGDRKRFDVYLEVIRSLKAIPGTSLRKAISVQLDEKIRLHTPSVHGELEQDFISVEGRTGICLRQARGAAAVPRPTG